MSHSSLNFGNNRRVVRETLFRAGFFVDRALFRGRASSYSSCPRRRESDMADSCQEGKNFPVPVLRVIVFISSRIKAETGPMVRRLIILIFAGSTA